MPNELLPLILEVQDDIVAHCSQMNFIRDLPGENRFEFTLKDLQNPQVAKNNCGIVSAQILAEFNFSSLIPTVTGQFTGIQTVAGNHFGILLSKSDLPEETSVIIDFTATQFDRNASIPLIMDCWEWQIWTEDKLGRQGHWKHSYAW